MPEITATLNDLSMPRIQRDFINTPQENATDVVTLSGEMYTDFISVEHSWTFNYESLTEAEYDALRAIYDSQFTLYEYPTLSIPFYDIVDQPVRMYINEKNIWNNCGSVQNVQFIFRITEQLEEGSS
jgi:hypothetical protein